MEAVSEARNLRVGVRASQCELQSSGSPRAIPSGKPTVRDRRLG